MTSRRWITTLALGGFAAGIATAPAAADWLLTLKSHTDAAQMMGQTTPAKDEVYLYWFGADAIRQDTGEMSTITRFDQKKLYCCLLYTSPSPRDRTRSRMPSSA